MKGHRQTAPVIVDTAVHRRPTVVELVDVGVCRCLKANLVIDNLRQMECQPHRLAEWNKASIRMVGDESGSSAHE